MNPHITKLGTYGDDWLLLNHPAYPYKQLICRKGVRRIMNDRWVYFQGQIPSQLFRFLDQSLINFEADAVAFMSEHPLPEWPTVSKHDTSGSPVWKEVLRVVGHLLIVLAMVTAAVLVAKMLGMG